MWNDVDYSKYRRDYYSDYRLDYNSDSRTITGGVYNQRMYEKNLKEQSLTPSEKDLQSAEALKEKLKGVTVTISPEAERYMAGLRERKEAQKVEKERMRQEWDSLFDPDDPFDRMGTYFSVLMP